MQSWCRKVSAPSLNADLYLDESSADEDLEALRSVILIWVSSALLINS